MTGHFKNYAIARSVLTIFLFLMLDLSFSTASAYEFETHAAITYRSILRSRLRLDREEGRLLITNLGIAPLVYTPEGVNFRPRDDQLGNQYYDMQGDLALPRFALDREAKMMVNTIGIDSSPSTLSGWIIRGVIREDDVKGDGPQDDPYGSFFRVFNHFYNPRNQLGLAPGDVPFSWGMPNLKWALGAQSPYDTPLIEDDGRRNHFTFQDAREAMYRAVTNKTKTGASIGLPISEETRKTYWATVFRALGDVIHLNQDMAQPQHTRNEAHSGVPENFQNGIAGHGSIMETYMRARAQGDIYAFDGGVPAAHPLLNLGNDSYPIPTFSKLSQYWTSGSGDASLNGTGLADFSHHNFFTAAKNIWNINPLGTYPSPYPSDYREESSLDDQGRKRTYLMGEVVDNYTGVRTPIKMIRKGAWSFLGLKGGYLIDTAVYDAQTDLLLPKAVAYSAGIINYFFRGKLKISLPSEGVYGIVDHSLPEVAKADGGGFKIIKVKLQNMTPDGSGNIEPFTGMGKLIGVMKFRRNLCYEPVLMSGQPGGSKNPLAAVGDLCRSIEEEVISSESVSVQDSINSEQKQEVSFNFTDPIPINATDLFLQVVYRGPLGNEGDAVVVATQDFSEPVYFMVDNFSDCEQDSVTGAYSQGAGSLFSLDLKFNSAETPVVKIVDLAPKTYSRIAILVDADTYSYTVASTIGSGSYTNVSDFNQLYDDQNRQEKPTAVVPVRHTTQGDLYFHSMWGIHGVTQPINCAPISPSPQPVKAILFESP